MSKRHAKYLSDILCTCIIPYIKQTCKLTCWASLATVGVFCPKCEILWARSDSWVLRSNREARVGATEVMYLSPSHTTDPTSVIHGICRFIQSIFLTPIFIWLSFEELKKKKSSPFFKSLPFKSCIKYQSGFWVQYVSLTCRCTVQIFRTQLLSMQWPKI